MRERCLRTQLISPMLAPLRKSARVVACFSSSVTPAAGAIQLAEAPPDSSTSTRSSAPAASASSQCPLGAGEAGLVGHRMAGFDHRDAPGRPAIAVAGDGDAVEPVRRHARRDNAASATSVSEPAALPAASMISRPRRRRLRQVRAAGSATDARPPTAARNRDSSNSRCVRRHRRSRASRLSMPAMANAAARASMFRHN